VVGSALFDYLAGSHDDRLAARIQVGIRPIVALFVDRDSYDYYRWCRFRNRIWRNSTLAYGGTPVRGRDCCSTVRRATVFGDLGKSAASRRPPMIKSGIIRATNSGMGRRAVALRSSRATSL
jgi:hypothetical protein